jgi:N-acetylglutamate synthase/N-acetylornithine aminotransferase
MALNEEQAYELLTFLVTSARIQQDEPAQYGSLRLLTAAERLSGFMMERSSSDNREFLAGVQEDIEQMTNAMADVEKFIASLDELCRAVAQHLVGQNGLSGGAS